MRLPDAGFWRGRRVLLTGHTGFKGAWAARLLMHLGAEVTGYALAPEAAPNLHRLLEPWHGIESWIADLRDRRTLAQAVASDPEVVLHFAAQPLVRRSVREPVATAETNIIGTLNLLSALSGLASLRAVLVVTSDKVYANAESGRPFREGDALGGHDPYSASKAAAELMCEAWRASGLLPPGAALGTVRAGNVIGGGDFAEDRLLPDAVRALSHGGPLRLRHPGATRPWQHVLDVLGAYLLYAEALAEGGAGIPPALNIGPGEAEPPPVRAAVDAFLRALGADVPVLVEGAAGVPEKQRLALDASLARSTLRWRPLLDFTGAVEWTARWYRAFLADPAAAARLTDRQINDFLRGDPCMTRQRPAEAAAGA